MRLRAAFLWTMIGSLLFAAVMGILVILFDGFGETASRILVTSLLVSAFSLICLACAVVLDRDRMPILMWIGLGSSVAALAIWLLLLWYDPWQYTSRWFDLFMKVGTTLTVVCCWVAHFGMLLLLPLQRRGWRAIRTATSSTTAVLGVAIVIAVWGEIERDWMGKLIAILSILASCGTVVTPILALIERIQRRGEPVTIQRILHVDLTCPRCGRDQRVLVGRSKCSGCGLRFAIDIEEPRCACGYPLYKLESERCPECGRAIPADQRWPTAPEEPAAVEAATQA